MNITISIVSTKGGSSKTTSSLNIAAALIELGHRVRLLDLDSPNYNLEKYHRSLGPDVECIATDNARELQDALQRDFDGITIIDYPPRLTEYEGAPHMALSHSDLVIIPIEAAPDGYERAMAFERGMGPYRKRRASMDTRFLITQVWKASETSIEIRDIARQKFKKMVFAAEIPLSPLFLDAAGAMQSILAFAPRSAGARQYRKVAQEIINAHK